MCHFEARSEKLSELIFSKQIKKKKNFKSNSRKMFQKKGKITTSCDYTGVIGFIFMIKSGGKGYETRVPENVAI
jgi:hypothetical protein